MLFFPFQDLEELQKLHLSSSSSARLMSGSPVCQSKTQLDGLTKTQLQSNADTTHNSLNCLTEVTNKQEKYCFFLFISKILTNQAISWHFFILNIPSMISFFFRLWLFFAFPDVMHQFIWLGIAVTCMFLKSTGPKTDWFQLYRALCPSGWNLQQSKRLF